MTKNVNQMDWPRLVMELQDYEAQGINIYLEGSLSSPFEVVEAMVVNEHSNYMRDYIFEDNGSLNELHFDKVRLS